MVEREWGELKREDLHGRSGRDLAVPAVAYRCMRRKLCGGSDNLDARAGALCREDDVSTAETRESQTEISLRPRYNCQIRRLMRTEVGQVRDQNVQILLPRGSGDELDIGHETDGALSQTVTGASTPLTRAPSTPSGSINRRREGSTGCPARFSPSMAKPNGTSDAGYRVRPSQRSLLPSTTDTYRQTGTLSVTDRVSGVLRD
ncbi:hypothetical protein AXG93_48s1290 [Marchantia polymorpha subsp. ruderalis]|uniref:Uncharacterized protein n=1 Tax=Marchantia polymorpha subsp. ruderalis TaxID=1480154 RepID=A0A176VWQ1_MARPO|nr:hypothetical protein AXG93_48s1290 [Marchantia polymorpha subsp. ruderalis]